jgi:chromosome segregation ATPase
MRWMFCVVLALVSAKASFAQSNSDSQGLDAIRMEIRQLRQDLRTLVGGAQRAQILVARVQVQDAAVKRAEERVDGIKSRLMAVQEENKQLNFEIKRNEQLLDQPDDAATAAGAKRRKEIEETIGRFKIIVEQRVATEQDMQARLAEAEEQLRSEQAKLGRLQDDLERLDKSLESPSR